METTPSWKQYSRSTNVLASRYDPDRETLEVEFIRGGIYTYFDVPQGLAAAMEATDSPGTFVHRHLKGRFRHDARG